MTAEAIPEQQSPACQQCRSRPVHLEDGSRDLAGWIRYDGATLGGEPHKAVICPACAVLMRGGAPDPRIKGWDAWCDTCHAWASEELHEDGDLDEDEPLTEGQAWDWERDHECQPDVTVANLDAAPAAQEAVA